MRTPVLTVGAALASGVLLLSGCESNPSGDGESGGLTVSATNDACEVSADTAESGTTSFEITNDGDIVTEFYVLGEDGLRIAAEQENIAPGASATLTVSLQPGDYFTACKPGLRGANVGETAFTVTGEPIELTGEDAELFDAAVASYVDFVKNEVAELAPNVEEFAQAYIDGDDDAAREMYATTRVNYERIEPLAEALGTLDPRIDYREVDYLAEAEELEADDPDFTEWLGFHRIEKDLWPPAEGDRNADGSDAFESWEESSTEDRKRVSEQLVADVNTLYDTVHDENFVEDQQINISTVSNGASGLLEEVAVTKVTGEENWWSHYDLWDFQANMEGSRIAFDLVRDIAASKGDEGAELVEEITEEYDEHVWIRQAQGPAWAVGGSYLVARRISMTIEVWDTLQLGEQERVTGRDKAEGAPLSGGEEFTPVDFSATDERGRPLVDERSHVFRVHPENNDGIRMLRRGYNFTDGNDAQGRLDAGQFFIAFVNAPERFARVHTSMARDDMFIEYLKTTGSAVFLVPPGVPPGTEEFVGQALFEATGGV